MTTHSHNELLGRLRAMRGFDAREVAAAKCHRLARFFEEQRLDSAVVGVSGGVDSALVLALLITLQRRGVLRRVIALLLPVEGRGATGQAAATSRGRLVTRALGAETWEAPLGPAQASLVESLAAASGLPSTAWAEGQALSVLRTPALYGAAALLQAHGFRSLVVGTTNRDEGAYLGFFGKASDAMVDLQPISDLHKSEVRALARLLNVPPEIVDATPRGDVHDGRTDEEMLGATYDEIELFLRLRELGRDALFSPGKARESLERQHAVNAHKYRVGNPAVHLDVMPRGVPGGWESERLSPRTERRPPDAAVPGAFAPPPVELDALQGLPRRETLGVPGFAAFAEGVLSPSDCKRLCDVMDGAAAEAVGESGMRDGYGEGSLRATAWSPELAGALWQRLAPIVPCVRFLDDPRRTWRVVGLSPLLRFARYAPGGRHVPHYDAGFDYGDGRRTLLSAVFYLTSAKESGALRFVRDGQEGLPASERDFADWSRAAREDEVLTAIHPTAGSAVVFDHRTCHDVQEWRGPGPRVLVRADVVYEAIPDGRP